MQWIVPKVWQGGRCFIIGGGPSLLKQFDVPQEIIQSVYRGSLSPSAYSPYLEPIHREHVVAVNVAYQIGNWIDVMFFGDESTLLENVDKLPTYTGLKVTCAPNTDHVEGLKWLRREQRKNQGLTDNPARVCWNFNSGSAAINMAVHTGVKQIVLLGFDMALDQNNNQHWHKFYAGKINEIHHTMNRHLSCFAAIASDAKRMGVEILNASEESRIQEFRKVNIKEVL